MDYHSLKRKELQSLCRKYQIPANMTNLAMADALSALNLVDRVEKTGKSMPESPVTGNKSSAKKTQSDLIDEKPRIPVGLARSRHAPLLEKSAALEEEVIPKTSAPRSCQEKEAGKIVSKAKENNKGKEKEVPVVTSRSTRLQQKSELKMSESVMKGGGNDEAKETDMLLEKAAASEEEVIPKTSEPRTCQEKAAGKIVSKAKENNNEKEKEVPVVNQITSRSTRLQQKSKLKMSEPVMKGGGKNEAKETDMLSEKVNVEEIESNNGKEKEVPVVNHITSRPTGLQQKSELKMSEPVMMRGGKNDDKETDVLSEKVNVEEMESNNGKEKEVPVANDITRRSTRLQQKSKLKKSVLKVGGKNEAKKKTAMLSEKVNVEEMKPESVVTDDAQQRNAGFNGNSLKEEQDDVVSGNISNIMVSSEVSMLDKSGDFEEITVGSNVISEDPSTGLIMVKDPMKKVMNNLEHESCNLDAQPMECEDQPVVINHTRKRSTRLQQKSKIKITESTVLKVEKENEADMLPVEVNVEEMKSESEVTDGVQQKSDGIDGNFSKEKQEDVVSGNVDGVENTGKSMPESPVSNRKSTARNPHSDLIDNEPRIRVGLARSRRAPLLENSSASEETIIPKTSAPRACQEKAAEKLVSKAKESNYGKEMEVPVITRRSTRVQQKSKLKITEPVLKVGGKNEADRLSVEVNVEEMKSESEVADDVQQKHDGTNGNSSKEEHNDVVSGNVDGVEKTGKSMPESPVTSRKSTARKPQPDLIDNEPRIRVGLARSRRAPLLENSPALEEAIIPKTLAPRACREKAAGKLVSKANETNNGNETEVPVITRRSTRVQQNPKLEITEPVLKVEGKIEADMLSVEVNVDKMKSESEVTDDDQQKNDGTNGNSSKEEHGDVVSGNVSSAMVSTELSMLEKAGDFEEITVDSDVASEDPSTALIMGELSEASTTHAFGESTSEDCSSSTISVRESGVNVADVPYESSLLEEKTEIAEVHMESEDQPTEINEVLGDKCVLEVNGYIELTYSMVTEAETLFGDESSPIVEKMDRFGDSDAVDRNDTLKCETELYNVKLNEVEELSLDSGCFSFEAMKESAEEAINENCNLDAQPVEREDQLMENELIEDKGGAHEMELKVRDENELTSVMVIEVETLSVIGSSPIVENMEKLEDSDAIKDKCMLECENGLLISSLLKLKHYLLLDLLQ